MGLIELSFLLLPLVAGILATAGYAVMTFLPPEFTTARRCFAIAGILVIIVVVIWGSAGAMDNRPLRLLIVGFITAIIAMATVEAIVWVNDRERKTILTAQTELAPAAQVASNKTFSFIMSPRDQNQLGSNRLDVDYSFINRTDDDVIIRSVFLNQAFGLKKSFNGAMDDEAMCRDMINISPELVPERFRGGNVKLRDGILVFSHSSSKIAESFVVPAHKSVTINDFYNTKTLDRDNNVMYYCPGFRFVDVEGNSKTAYCIGTHAGMLITDNQFDGGIMRGGRQEASIILPSDKIKNCVIDAY